MKIAWVLSEGFTGKLAVESMKEVAPMWASSSVYPRYPVDNLVSYDFQESSKLIRRGVHTVCNFYIPEHDLVKLGNPTNINPFSGEFTDQNIDNKDDVVVMNLASNIYDVILMVGFSFAKPKTTNKLEQHRTLAYHHNIKQVILDNDTVQYVLVNYRGKLSKEYSDLDNLTRDSLANVVNLLK